MFLSLFLVVVWLAILIYGAEIMIKWASSISKNLWIPSIVIGLTIVAFGTSAPELIVNIMSALKGTTDLAVWNVIGSNIVNILLILGLSAMIGKIQVQRNTTWKELPFAILAAGALYLMANDIMLNGEKVNLLTKSEWFLLLGFFAIFIYYTVGLIFSNKNSAENDEEIKVYPMTLSLLMTLAGLILLFFWGKLLVNNAVILAEMAGVSQMLIGLTIVAIGTSLPELVTCIVAVRKKQSDLVIGNIVGSNIFNTFWILGVTALIAPVPVSDAALFDIMFNLCITIGVMLFLFIEKDLIIKWSWVKNVFHGEKYLLNIYHGAILVTMYIGYISYLIYRW